MILFQPLTKDPKTAQRFHTWLRVIMCGVFLFPVLISGCGGSAKTKELPADYGDYGSSIALALATQFPYRLAYSQEEKDAGAYIKSEFIKLGYDVEEQTFSSIDGTGSSTNYIVRIKGEGLMFKDASGKYVEKNRQVVVGAHYDTIYGTQDSAAVPAFDGIQDNASGIGALFTLAKELRTAHVGYDVILVAFGSGDKSFMGSRAFVSQMSAAEIASTDAMYCIESIYAGDKLYASAGKNSLAPGKKYEMRRKLYEAYDVVYDNQLASLNGVDLLYNESGIMTDLNMDQVDDVYREVTLTPSDYVPFDEAGIPIVFFESFDYNYSTLAEMKETKNLNLQDFGGMVRHTADDASTKLQAILPPDQLVKRINNTAFIILKAIEKGAHDSISKEQYAAGVTIAPVIHITTTITPKDQQTESMTSVS